MARFPTYERSVGLQGGSTASYASDGAFTAPARALAAGGADIADVGNYLAKVQGRIRQTQDDTWFSKARAETALDMQSEEMESQKSATDGAQNFTAGMSQRYAEYRKAKVAGAPSPRAADMYSQWADGFGVDVTGRAAKFQAESELAKRTTDFTDAMNAHAQAIYADPSQFDAVYKRAMDDFEGAKQWMTPEQEQVAREKVEHDLKLSRAKSKVDFSPEDFIQEVGRNVTVKPSNVAPDVRTRGQQAMSFFIGKGYTKAQAAGIVGNLIAESNLKPSGAVGDNGTAFGIAQWRGERLTRLKRFANANGRHWEDFETQLAFVDSELQSHETDAYQRLKSAKNVDEATAAFIGYERPAGWSSGNPRGGHNYKGRLSHAAAMAGEDVTFHEGGDFSTDPRFAGLSVDEMRSLSSQAEQAVNTNATNAYNAAKDSIELGIATGQVISEDQILGSNLRDGDKATLLGKFRTRNEEVGQLTADLAALSDGSLTLDPYSSKDKARADNLYSEILKKAGDEGAVAVAAGVLEQTGVVPQPIINAIRKGLDSRNPQDFVSAVQTASRVSQLDPAALGRRDGGNEVQKAADDFSHYVNRLNLSPEDAAKRMIDDRNPEKKFDRKALEPAAKEFVKTLEGEDVGAVFDDSMLGWRSNPAVGFDPGRALGIKAEYLAIAEDQFYAANGNPEIAKNRAAEEMKRLYGVTEITGSPVVMKHPPERYWPAFDAQRLRINEVAKKYGGAPTEEGPLTYREQLQADILELDEAADLGSVQLVTTPETDAMIKRGEMPGYGVLYKDKNGNLQTIPGKLWLPEFSRLEGIQREDDARREKDSREYRERTREKIRIREQNREANPLALPGVN